MSKDKNPKTKQVLEDQDLYEEIMSEVHRLRSLSSSPEPVGEKQAPAPKPDSPPGFCAAAGPPENQKEKPVFGLDE